MSPLLDADDDKGRCFKIATYWHSCWLNWMLDWIHFAQKFTKLIYLEHCTLQNKWGGGGFDAKFDENGNLGVCFLGQVDE